MATIRNSITLTDRMTPTLRSIMKAMDSTLRAMERLDRQTNNGTMSRAYKRAVKDVQAANNAILKLKNQTDKASQSANQAQRSYTNMSSAATRAGTAMSALGGNATSFIQSLAAGVYLAEKLMNTLSGVMETADASRSQVARLGLYNTTNTTNEEYYGRVLSTAMDTRTGLTDTADLTNKILISGVFDGESAIDSAIGTAGLINKAMVAGGSTAEESSRALRQLTQGLASGVLQGDELRSIREQTPYFAQVLAEGLGKIDKQFEGIGIGDLKELGSQGVLTSDKIIQAMWAMQDEINNDFSQMPKTFGQAMTSMGNLWQYFLWMLSDAEGPLGKINSMMWQFVDYLQTPKGLEFMNTIAIGLNIIATLISVAMAKIGEFIVFLQDNSAIAQSIFIALATVAIAAAVAVFVAWVAATWPILLVIGLIALISYQFLKAGYTASEVVGFIVGIVMAAAAIIWDIILMVAYIIIWTAAIILVAVIGLGAGIILIILGVVQLIIWAAMLIGTILLAILTVIQTVFLLGKAAVQTFVNGVISLFYGMAQVVIGILGSIAKAIDAVFGSNLSGAVSGWSSTLEGKYTAFIQDNDPSKTMDEIGDAWNKFGSSVESAFTSDRYNLYGEIGGVIGSSGNAIEGILDAANGGSSILDGLALDPSSMYNMGSSWGSGLVDEIGGLNLGIPSNSILGNMSGSNALDALDALTGGSGGAGGSGGSGVPIDGGNLDSVGSINSDVSLADEDLQLLRDMAAREYLLQLQTVTPVANVTFGDVKETADVGKIIEVIEQMVEEQMATSLVD